MLRRFGYSWVPIDEFMAHRVDIETFVNENGWRVVVGTLGAGILEGEKPIVLKFGEKPDRKTIKRIIKETKNGTSRTKSTRD